MKGKRIISLLLAIIITASIIPCVPCEAAINERQVYFRRVIGSYARADMYKNNLLASFTVGQAIFESGWGRSGLAIIGKNLFGIKAYSTWGGLVYDQNDGTLYSSYDDLLIATGDYRTASPWRSYTDWADSVADHAALINGEDRYVEVRGEMDYKKASYAVVEAGYTSDYGYSARLIQIIEQYDLTEFDDITPNEYGIIAMEMDQAYVKAVTGRTHQLSFTTIEAERPDDTPDESDESTSDESASDESTSDESASDESASDESTGDESVSDESTGDESTGDESTSDESTGDESDESGESTSGEPAFSEGEVAWESLNTSVATVDENGLVTAVGAGVSLIRAYIGDREACCLYEVSAAVNEYDAYTIETLNVRAEASTTAAIYGKFNKGQGLFVEGGEVNGWLLVEGIGSDGKKLKGWSSAAYIKFYEHEGTYTKIGFSKYIYTLPKGGSADVIYAAGPADAVDKSIKWTSSNTSVVTVTDGKLKAVGYGTATVTASSAGAKQYCRVDVSDAIQTYTGLATAKIYVRKEASASSKSLGILPEDAKVTVTGEETGGWYNVTGVTTNGKTVTGWSNARYIYIKGISSEVTEPDPTPVVDDKFAFASDNILLYDGFLYGFQPEDTVKDLLSVSKNGMVCVVDKAGEPMSDGDRLCTGSRVMLISGGEVIADTTIIIKGDVCGDGVVNAADYLFIKRHFIGTLLLSPAGLAAADISCDGYIDVTDYIMIVRYFLGNYSIRQEAVFKE